ncbi:MAG: hypothetical protein HZC17_01430 [Candidatus Omnitrophica bacterium]|nr:hypothetical protein [Candidatus Omnitrophota bacterium]
MKNILLGISGIIFGIIAIMHFLRLLMKWPVILGPVTIDSSVSLWAGLIFVLLSAACFFAASKNGKA